MAEEGIGPHPCPPEGEPQRKTSPRSIEIPINRNFDNSRTQKERKTSNATQESSRVAFAYFSFFTFHFQFIPIASSTFMVAPDVLFT